jgi:hypothetical protein
MRHQRHYVEQLMGDAPIRTVRDIAVADIELPPDDAADVRELEQSIRRMGVLEPLLVSQEGRRYHLITGSNRLRAARNAGLHSVPCIVHDVDEEMRMSMREAATRRAIPPDPAPPAPAEPPRDLVLPPAFSEVTRGLNFVSSLLPAITAAGEDRFRWSVLTELAGIELLRARTVAAAAEVLAGPPALQRVQADCAALLKDVVASLAGEARLRGIGFDLQTPDADYTTTIDPSLVTTALTGFLQSFLSALPPGTSLRIHGRATIVRPAFIVQVTQESIDLEADVCRQFFDGDWREHPAGGAGALLLAAAARIARLHGGRADVQPLPVRGCIATFVIPKPILP